MERRSFVRAAGLAGVLAAGVAPAVHAQAAIRWRLASSFPKSLDTIFGAAETFAKAVGDMSGGRFQITVAAPGEIVPAFGVDDAVRNGTVEMSHTAPYYFVGKNEAFAFGTAVPFGLNARQINAWMVEGNGEKLMREFYADFNIVNFIGGNTGAQMGGFWRKEIKSLPDLRGQKMRIGGFGGRIMERIGAVPQMIPGGEIYQALEKGTIDSPPSGSAPTTTRSSAWPRSPATTPTPGSGRAAQGSSSGSTRAPSTRCRPSTRPCSRTPRCTPRP